MVAETLETEAQFEQERPPRLPDIINFPEGHRQIVEAQLTEVIKLVSKSVPAELTESLLTRVTYLPRGSELTGQQYGIEPIAEISGGRLEVYETFFAKSPEQQRYILTHELSHSLSERVVLRDPNFRKQFLELSASADLRGETEYTKNAIERARNGELAWQSAQAEQLAERLTAHLWGEGDLANSLAAQAAFTNNPTSVFNGVPPEILSNEQAMREYLETQPSPNVLIEDARNFNTLFTAAINGYEPTAPIFSDYDEWEEIMQLGHLELDDLGASESMTAFSQQAPQRKGESLYQSFLKIFFG